MLLKSDLNSNKHNLIQQFDFYCNKDYTDFQIRVSIVCLQLFEIWNHPLDTAIEIPMNIFIFRICIKIILCIIYIYC